MGKRHLFETITIHSRREAGRIPSISRSIFHEKATSMANFADFRYVCITFKYSLCIIAGASLQY